MVECEESMRQMPHLFLRMHSSHSEAKDAKEEEKSHAVLAKVSTQQARNVGAFLAMCGEEKTIHES